MRACNEAGFSEWSPWNQPVSPHHGVHVTNEADYLSSASSAHKSAETLLSESSSSSAAAAAAANAGADADGTVLSSSTPNSDPNSATDVELPSLATGASVSVLIPGENSTPSGNNYPNLP